MKASERPKKPRLKRTKPVRAWSGMFAGAEAAARPNVESAARARKGSARAGRAGENGGSGIPDAVKLGYTVLQDYLDEARQEAERTTGARPGSGAAPDPQRLTQRLFQYTSDLTNLWLEILQSATLREPRREPSRGSAGPFTNGHAPAGASMEEPRSREGAAAAAAARTWPPRVSLRVFATRPVSVSVDLKPDAIGGPLVAHELRSTDPEAPRLRGVELDFHATDNRVSVAIHVPDDLPSGVYSGLFIDARDNLPRGTLSVAVQS